MRLLSSNQTSEEITRRSLHSKRRWEDVLPIQDHELGTEIKKLKSMVSGSLKGELQLIYDKFVFDLRQLEPEFDKDFSIPNTPTTYALRGGHPYNRPTGWKRYALKVKGKYENDDWLESSNGYSEWPVTYHGTSFWNQLSDLLPLNSILKDGFKISGGRGAPPQGASYGKGIYTCPNIGSWPSNYSVPHEILVQDENNSTVVKKFKLVFQCRVHPQGFSLHANDIWLVSNPMNLRPYGILIKEHSPVNQSYRPPINNNLFNALLTTRPGRTPVNRLYHSNLPITSHPFPKQFGGMQINQSRISSSPSQVSFPNQTQSQNTSPSSFPNSGSAPFDVFSLRHLQRIVIDQ
eukprot:TRINITY_DN16255_c0_g1_i1.p1 TRINITY_DN16255_c0_g1~~TRINITY_DN16255_c0_g1_i1.p1  ORF type:complete len:348 (-),score=28.81 TRINITY_DN16255_c0_g1_i1:4-1047(-)